MSGCSRIILVFSVLLLGACQTTPDQNLSVKSREFRMTDLAKSDVDMIAEVQLSSTLEYLQQLAEKLYKRNPKEWRRLGVGSVDEALQKIFSTTRPKFLAELKGKRSAAAIQLAFTEDYSGDRVLALVEGVRGMLLDAHNGKQEFYLLDELDPQKLYNMARNIEIVVWRLSHTQDAEGRLLLISNETEGELKNLSFERLFGKMIALQDSMARVVAETTNRRIKNIIQSMASAVFLPI